jgi:hypothetical protein
MADERKANGGARPGAGRKPKADEIKLVEQMDAVLVPESVWMSLAEKVEAGDTNAIKTWLQYRYGMPKQIVQNTNINVEEKDLTDEEIQKIKNNLKNAY